MEYIQREVEQVKAAAAQANAKSRDVLLSSETASTQLRQHEHDLAALDARVSESVKSVAVMQSERGQLIGVVQSIDALKRQVRSHLEVSEQAHARMSQSLDARLTERLHGDSSSALRPPNGLHAAERDPLADGLGLFSPRLGMTTDGPAQGLGQGPGHSPFAPLSTPLPPRRPTSPLRVQTHSTTAACRVASSPPLSSPARLHVHQTVGDGRPRPRTEPRR